MRMYVSVCVYVCCICVSASGGQRRVQDFQSWDYMQLGAA